MPRRRSAPPPEPVAAPAPARRTAPSPASHRQSSEPDEPELGGGLEVERVGVARRVRDRAPVQPLGLESARADAGHAGARRTRGGRPARSPRDWTRCSSGAGWSPLARVDDHVVVLGGAQHEERDGGGHDAPTRPRGAAGERPRRAVARVVPGALDQTRARAGGCPVRTSRASMTRPAARGSPGPVQAPGRSNGRCGERPRARTRRARRERPQLRPRRLEHRHRRRARRAPPAQRRATAGGRRRPRSWASPRPRRGAPRRRRRVAGQPRAQHPADGGQQAHRVPVGQRLRSRPWAAALVASLKSPAAPARTGPRRRRRRPRAPSAGSTARAARRVAEDRGAGDQDAEVERGVAARRPARRRARGPPDRERVQAVRPARPPTASHAGGPRPRPADDDRGKATSDPGESRAQRRGRVEVPAGEEGEDRRPAEQRPDDRSPP